MKIVFSHKSALEYWRLHSNINISDTAKKRRCRLPATIPHISEISNIVPEGLSYPVSLLINNQKAKRKSRIVKTRVYTKPTPDWGIVDLGNDVAVSSPEFCFFQMAGEISLIKLIELGYELCGTYSKLVKNVKNQEHNSRREQEHNNKHEQEYINGYEVNQKLETKKSANYGHSKITSTKDLGMMTKRLKGMQGQRNASRAVKYIDDGSASPMETILIMLLSLPQNLGGYGLSAPELNFRIDLGKIARKGSQKSYYVCDLYWPESKLAVEYDSDKFHTGADHIAKDSMKRADLAAQGITVLTVTSRQIRNVFELDGFAKLVAAKLGIQLRYRNPEFPEAQYGLRKQLL